MSVATCALPGCVSSDPSAQGSAGPGIGAMAVALHLWQAPRVYIDTFGSKALQPFYP